MEISVLALNGVFDTGLATVLDALGTANGLAPTQVESAAPFSISVLGVRRRVETSQGLRVPVMSLARAGRPDWVIVPALGNKMPEALVATLGRRDVGEAAEFLRACSSRGSKIAAACIGTFVLAESGLLDGERATTTWWLAPLFRQRYPNVALEASRMIVPSGRFLTAGAALSHLDMALWLIRQVSPELAMLTSKYLVTDSRLSQSMYAISDHLAHADPLVARFEHWAREHLAQGFALDDAAAALATSKRTLARRIAAVLGKTPLSYVQDLRAEHAAHLLKTTAQSVEDIASAVGYSDGVTLRALLRRRFGKGVRELRASVS